MSKKRLTPSKSGNIGRSRIINGKRVPLVRQEIGGGHFKFVPDKRFTK